MPSKQILTQYSGRILRANSRYCSSLLITCSMSKTLFKRFRCAMNMPLFTGCFYCYDFFFDVFIVNFEQISHQFYFYLLSVLYWIQKKTPEVFFKKRCSLKLRNIFRKTPVLGSLFNKVVGLQDCKYIKKRLQHRCFVRNLRKFLRTNFLKNICERLLL